MRTTIAIVIALAACEPHDVLGTGWDLPGLDVVYQCDVDGTEVELCWPDGKLSLEASLVEHGLGATASCHDTPRHPGPCWYQCPSATGCNAFGGCWCPDNN